MDLELMSMAASMMDDKPIQPATQTPAPQQGDPDVMQMAKQLMENTPFEGQFINEAYAKGLVGDAAKQYAYEQAVKAGHPDSGVMRGVGGAIGRGLLNAAGLVGDAADLILPGSIDAENRTYTTPSGEKVAVASDDLPIYMQPVAGLKELGRKAQEWLPTTASEEAYTIPHYTGAAAETATQSLAALAPVAIAAPEAAAGWLGAAAVGGLYGAAEADQFINEADKMGVPRSKSEPLALLSGIVEGGLETLADRFALKFLGGEGAAKLGKDGVKKWFLSNLKNFALDDINEMWTEVTQGKAESMLREQAGIRPDDFGLKQAKETAVVAGLAPLAHVPVNAASSYAKGKLEGTQENTNDLPDLDKIINEADEEIKAEQPKAKPTEADFRFGEPVDPDKLKADQEFQQEIDKATEDVATTDEEAADMRAEMPLPGEPLVLPDDANIEEKVGDRPVTSLPEGYSEQEAYTAAKAEADLRRKQALQRIDQMVTEDDAIKEEARRKAQEEYEREIEYLTYKGINGERKSRVRGTAENPFTKEWQGPLRELATESPENAALYSKYKKALGDLELTGDLAEQKKLRNREAEAETIANLERDLIDKGLELPLDATEKDFAQAALTEFTDTTPKKRISAWNDDNTLSFFTEGTGYPVWFEGNGWTKKEAVNALEKYLAGKKLGVRQREIVDAALDYWRFRHEDNKYDVQNRLKSEPPTPPVEAPSDTLQGEDIAEGVPYEKPTEEPVEGGESLSPNIAEGITEEHLEELKPVIEQIGGKNIEIITHDSMDVDPHDESIIEQLRERGWDDEQIRSFQKGGGRVAGSHTTVVTDEGVKSLINLSLQDANDQTVFHELTHRLVDLALNAKEKAFLLKKYGSREGISDAFQKKLDALHKRKPVGVAEKAFAKMKELWERVRNFATAKGWNSETALARKMYEGEYAGKADEAIGRASRQRQISDIDAEYFDALARGDEERAQELVEEAAKRAEYDIEGYHGTPFGRFGERAKAVNKERARQIEENKKIRELYWQEDAALDDLEDASRKQYGRRIIWTPDRDAYVDLRKYLKELWDSTKPVLADPVEEGEVFRYVGTNDEGYLGRGFYIAADKKAAEQYAKMPSRTKFPGEKYDPVVYKLAAKISNLFDHNNDSYSQAMADFYDKEMERLGFYVRDFRDRIAIATTNTLKEFGYDGVTGTITADGKEYVVWDSNQLKLLDTVTRDDEGNIIPLSQRFNPEKDDIRYNVSNLDAEYFDALARGDEERAQALLRKRAEELGVNLFENDDVQGFKIRRSAPPKKTIKGYKVFRIKNGELYPLFIGAKESLPAGVWLDAKEGGGYITRPNGLKAVITTQGGVYHNFEKNPWLVQELKKVGRWDEFKDKKGVNLLAYRPGWHGGDLPFFPQGGKSAPGSPYGKILPSNYVVAEVEFAADKDYQQEYIDTAERNKKGEIDASLSGVRHVPENGYYEYATNTSNRAKRRGNWLISGAMKINRLLSESEVGEIMRSKGMEPQGWVEGGVKWGRNIAPGELSHGNRKLADVTYDDEGNIIPLSQRFNPKKEDIRYQPKKEKTFKENLVSPAEAPIKGAKETLTWLFSKTAPTHLYKLVPKNMRDAIRGYATTTELRYRHRAGERHRKYRILEESLKDAKKYFENNPKLGRESTDYYEVNGAKGMAKALKEKGFSEKQAEWAEKFWDKLYRPAADALYDTITQFKDINAIANYVSHIYKDPVKADRILQDVFSKSNFEGSKYFTKQRVIDTLRKAEEEHGLERASDNPVKMLLAYANSVHQYEMANQLFRDLRDQGVLFTGREVAEMPKEMRELMKPLDDKMAEKWVPVFYEYKRDAKDKSHKKGDKKKIGNIKVEQLYAPVGAADMLNNVFSGNMLSGPTARGLNRVNAALNAAQLGFSTFHANFIMALNAVNDLATAIRALTRGDVKKAAKLTGKAALFPAFTASAYKHGKQIAEAYRNPEAYAKADKDTRAIVDAIVAANGRVKMDDVYRVLSEDENVKTIVKKIKSGDIFGGTAKGLGLVLQKVMAPLMEHMVPMMKLHAFATIYEEELAAHPDATAEERAKIAKEAWNRTDDRMGQMTYDNLFWDKTFKTAMHLSLRSVGWNLGDVRELGGSFTDSGTAIKAAATGKFDSRKHITQRIAFAMALTTITAYMGAIMTYLMTGEPPDELIDYFAPETGKTLPNGAKARLSIPTYFRDLVAVGRQGVATTIGHKLSPLFAMFKELAAGENYFGEEISSPDSTPIEKVQEYAKWGAKHGIPFSVQGMLKSKKDTGDSTAMVLSALGFTPAPRYITQTEWEKMVSERMALRFGGTKSHKQAARSRFLKEIENKWRQTGVWDEKKLEEAKAKGYLKDIRRFKNSRKVPGVVRGFAMLPVDDQVALYEKFKKKGYKDGMKAVEPKLKPQAREQLGLPPKPKKVKSTTSTSIPKGKPVIFKGVFAK